MLGVVLNSKSQTREQNMLSKMASFFEKTIIATYPKSESGYYDFLKDFIKEHENGETTEIISHINVKELNNLNNKIQRKGMFQYFYRYNNPKIFKNINNVPDSIFESFKFKYKYNAVRLTNSYLKYYLENNNSESAQYIKQQNESTGEISPLTFSLYLKPRLNELNCRKNKELMTLIFWPYLCYKSGIDFYPNQPSD